MKMKLTTEDLFGYIDGSEIEPTDDAVIRKYKQRRDKALANIVLAIEPKLLYLIGDPTDPKALWTKLQNIFQRKTWANKLQLKK